MEQQLRSQLWRHALGAASAAVRGGHSGSEQPFSLGLVCQVCWVLYTEAVWVPFIAARKKDYAGHL